MTSPWRLGLLALALYGNLACSDDEEVVDTPTVDALRVEVRSIALVHNETTMQQFVPKRVEVSVAPIEAEGFPVSADVVVGLVRAGNGDPNDRDHCTLGHSVVTFTEKDEIQHFAIDGMVYTDCEIPEEGADFHFFVDAVYSLRNDDTIYFTPSGSNSNCESSADGAPCDQAITVQTSTSAQVHITHLKPESSVGYVPNAVPHADMTDGDEEIVQPILDIQADISLYGLPPTHEGLATDELVRLTYGIRAASESEGAWMPLEVKKPHDTAELAKTGNSGAHGHDAHAEFDAIAPLTTLHVARHLYVSQENAVTLREAGGKLYNLRVCASLEKGGTHQGVSCQVTQVVILPSREDEAAYVYGSFPHVEMIAGQGWANSVGNASTERIVAGVRTEILRSTYTSNGDSFIPSPAGTEVEAVASGYVDMSGWVNFSVASAGARALFSNVKSPWETSQGYMSGRVWLQTFGYYWVDKNMRIESGSPKTYERNLELAKSICYTFGYTVLVASVTIELCAGGALGVNNSMNLHFATGADIASLSDRIRLSNVEFNAGAIMGTEPYVRFDLTAVAAANFAILEARVNANLALANVRINERASGGPAGFGIGLGLDAANNLHLKGTADANFDLRLLDGEVYADGEYWSFFDWNALGPYHIASWHGPHYSIPIMHRSFQRTF